MATKNILIVVNTCTNLVYDFFFLYILGVWCYRYVEPRDGNPMHAIRESSNRSRGENRTNWFGFCSKPILTWPDNLCYQKLKTNWTGQWKGGKLTDLTVFGQFGPFYWAISWPFFIQFEIILGRVFKTYFKYSTFVLILISFVMLS